MAGAPGRGIVIDNASAPDMLPRFAVFENL
jgi:hypothetical protein